MKMLNVTRAGELAARASRLFLTAVLTVAASCSDSTSPSAALQGQYALTAVNGSSLPATVQSGGQSLTFTNGALTMSDSTYHFVACIQSTAVVSSCGAGFATLTGDGSWHLQNGTLSFTDRVDGIARQATMAGATITVDYGAPSGLHFGFAKAIPK